MVGLSSRSGNYRGVKRLATIGYLLLIALLLAHVVKNEKILIPVERGNEPTKGSVLNEIFGFGVL